MKQILKKTEKAHIYKTRKGDIITDINKIQKSLKLNQLKKTIFY